MNNVSLMSRGALAPTENAAMLALIKRTVAVDTNNDEFELFIHMCRSLRLDPLRKQAYALVYNKNKPDKRRMSLITAIDGFRAIADRTGNYRPDDEEPDITYDEKLKSTVNPHGIIKAKVRVFKFSHGEWHRVTASARWDEYAPIKDEWADDPETGKGNKTGRQILDNSGQWGKMGHVMIAKCAEALALRKAWPDDLSNVYAEEEVARSQVEISAIEIMEQAEAQARLAKIGGPAITVDWMDGQALEGVPVGQFAERAVSFIEKEEDPVSVMAWADRNRHALREFWSHNKTDANEIKRRIEAAHKRADVLTGAVLQAG